MRWMALVMCVAACGGKSEKSNEQMQKEHKAPVQAKLAAIKAAAEAGHGHASDPGVPAVAGLEFRSYEKAANAMIVHYADTQDPTADATPELRFISRNDDDLLRAKAFTGVKIDVFGGHNWYVYEPELKRFEATKYVLVVYPGTVQLPHKGVGDEFMPGSITSDAVLVELDSNKVLGGYTASAESSDEVKTTNADGHIGEDEHYQRAVEHDLGKQWGKAITDGATKRWPGASVPSFDL